MTTIETSLGHLEAVAAELHLRLPVSYVFKLGCGCSVYDKEDVLGHLWDKCEHQDSEFWCERYAEFGRTVKHHVRINEIDTRWAGVFVLREDLVGLKNNNGEELERKLAHKNAHEYADILKTFDPIFRSNTMTILDEKNMRDQITEWYLRENVIPPEFEGLQVLALAKNAYDSILSAFAKEPELERLTLFGFGDSLGE